MKLSNGYYAPGPTRAIKITESEALLVSGRPSSHFLDRGLEIEFKGISRVFSNTSEEDLEAKDILVQSQKTYIDAENVGNFDYEYLQEFISMRENLEWKPSADWEAYLGNIGYGFNWGDDVFEVTTEDGTLISLWKSPVEFGGDEFWLKLDPADSMTNAEMVKIPYKYRRQVCLLLDDISWLTRRVELTPMEGGIRLSTKFPPPRPQGRWLNAIGAQWEESKQDKIHWRLDPADKESVEQAFRKLAVNIEDATVSIQN